MIIVHRITCICSSVISKNFFFPPCSAKPPPPPPPQTHALSFECPQCCAVFTMHCRQVVRTWLKSTFRFVRWTHPFVHLTHGNIESRSFSSPPPCKHMRSARLCFSQHVFRPISLTHSYHRLLPNHSTKQTGIALDDVAAAWRRPFETVDPTQGGCPPL
jgi:hypothetical protein